MRTALLVLTALVAIAVTGCGGTESAASPSPSPTANADACRAYDNALRIYHEGIEGESVPMTILTFSAETAAQIRTAAQLVEGSGRTAMEDTATRIEVLADKEKRWQAPGFNNSAEILAVRDSITRVAGICQTSGASLINVPA
jgi:hypothetical protein